MNFLPGDRVERVGNCMNATLTAGAIQIGDRATVTNGRVHPRNAANGCDFEFLADGESKPRDGRARDWRRIDGPSDQSAAAFVRSLGSADSIRERIVGADGEWVL
jgi:hypothetical protein